MAFPVTPRFFFKFRFTDTGLTPSFVVFKNSATLANIGAPAVVELSGGIYYFDYTFTALTDPEVVYQIDGGAGLPSDVRYSSGTIHPKDYAHEDMVASLARLLGLSHENSVMDVTSFTLGKLAAARVRLYDSKANADAASAASPGAYNTGKVAEYAINAVYSGFDLLKYTVTKTP